MVAEHDKASQKGRQDLNKQVEEMKKKDLDMSAANKILKR